ncbi:peptidoglycan recognition protein 1-like [Microplitis demolitor]|uniref:peptidoglycan recognition protein 1-like n=1 Tax=Microplitis demolitor TaxID=69319 RepID=UPI00235B6793|nr:peptidoglycan recognition protein 1-like [Microplitis demolitor]
MKYFYFILLNCLLIILNKINCLSIDKIIEHECPRIMSRQEWNARNVSGHELLWTRPTPYIVIHHGGILHYCYDIKECSLIVKSYQDLHIDTNKWIDIGYNFVIGEDGNIYEARGWDYIGAHAPGFNTQSIGISIIGDFSHFQPNKNALKALDNLIACGVLLNKISPNYQVIGHRQSRVTACPGEVFYSYVKSMPRWTSTPVPVYNNNSSLIDKVDSDKKN